ncbi:peptidylprolyl isomerase [Neolewinella antarctica]|uniref:Peptidyl-prolyl cis-trans isomerase n=1 Tax=Neolewinella antarctica TaxID=442734 RepID=A0ABX0XFQ1_9BACT|nr:peptidylprolyl isomerase [Neolewinella antarctica]NJC27603.1 peptidyl-prolyl cis-trans isomerase B (cyclophilin B) [Neolewinella antarctica]
MRNLLYLGFLVFCVSIFASCGGNSNDVLIETSQGDIVIRLFDETPKHRDNFKKLVAEGYYDGTLFHRVIPTFMIQGGDPQSIGATPDQPLGGGGPGYMIDQEIGSPHLRGAVAAARTQNPEKASSGSQFYIVTGQPQSAASIDQIQTMKSIQYSPEQRAAYEKDGGRPDLDMDYTVFGEVVSGMDVVDKISALATGRQNRPTEDVVMETVIMK